MNGQGDFAQTLADFLALHTEQSSRYLKHLIRAFLRGAVTPAGLNPLAKKEVATRVQAEIDKHNGVPTYVENYLLAHLRRDEWPPQAAFIASQYLHHWSGERFASWQRRQKFIAELGDELIGGSEFGFRQRLYGPGAGTVFRWRGFPCFKTANDIAIYTMLIHELQPNTIIELGSGAGGSGLFFADVCTSMELTTRVISVDAMAAEISDPRITFIQSDCSAWLEAISTSNPEFRRPCLMVEDFHGDLAGCFEYIDAILETDDYLVIEDSADKQKRISEVIAGRSYLVDSKYTDFFGINCTSAANSIFVKGTGANVPRVGGRQERQLLRAQGRAWRRKDRA